MDVNLGADGDFVVDRHVCPYRKRVFTVTDTAPSTTRGAFPLMVTCSWKTTGKGVTGGW